MKNILVFFSIFCISLLANYVFQKVAISKLSYFMLIWDTTFFSVVITMSIYFAKYRGRKFPATNSQGTTELK